MKLLRKILIPFSVCYAIIIFIRNKCYDLGIFSVFEFKTPGIVVGNLSVGGTGKSPMIEYLIRLLKDSCNVAVLSRGYKRKSHGFILADEYSNAAILGDEPFQFFTKFQNIRVAVDADRKNGVKALESLNEAPEVILLDDAFQHRRVKAGLNILLTTYNDLYVDDFMLPTGNLREGTYGAKRAQIIVVTKCPTTISSNDMEKIVDKLNPLAYQEVFFTTISYNSSIQGQNDVKLTALKNAEVLLVTGIANPLPLQEFLNEQEIRYKHLKFPDHHHFSERDIIEIKNKFNAIRSDNKYVLCTEKDYVRLSNYMDNLYYLGIKTTFLTNKDAFDTKIITYVEQGSGNS